MKTTPVDIRWLQRKALLFFISLGGIAFAASIPVDPNGVSSTTTNMLAKPATNPFDNCVAASAIVEAYGDNIYIGVPYSSLIEKRYVNVYDRVQEGDPIVGIDSRDIRAKIEVDKALITIKTQELRLLETQLQRYLSLDDPRAISQEEVTTKQSQVQVAQAELEEAIETLRLDEIELSRRTIRAPKAGTVLKIDYHPGEFIEAKNLTEHVTQNLIIIGETQFLQVRVEVDEENASRVKPGSRAVGYPRGVVKHAFDLEFIRIEPYVIPKKNLTGNSEEIVDTRVLQVLYKLQPVENFRIYPGQQFDVYIEADPVPISNAMTY